MVSVIFLLASLSPKFDRGTRECLNSNHILYPTPSEVKMRVHNRLELKNSSNVLGIIQGAVEPGEPVCTKPCHSPGSCPGCSPPLSACPLLSLLRPSDSGPPFRSLCDLWKPSGQLGRRSRGPQHWHRRPPGDHSSPGDLAKEG